MGRDALPWWPSCCAHLGVTGPCVIWLIHMCQMTPSYVWYMHVCMWSMVICVLRGCRWSHTCIHACVYEYTHIHVMCFPIHTCVCMHIHIELGLVERRITARKTHVVLQCFAECLAVCCRVAGLRAMSNTGLHVRVCMHRIREGWMQNERVTCVYVCVCTEFRSVCVCTEFTNVECRIARVICVHVCEYAALGYVASRKWHVCMCVITQNWGMLNADSRACDMFVCVYVCVYTDLRNLECRVTHVYVCVYVKLRNAESHDWHVCMFV